MPTLAEVNVRIGADIQQLKRGLNRAERELTRTGRKLDRIGSNLSTALTLPLIAAGGAAFKFAVDFESSFTKIQTLVGISGSQLDKFRVGISNISQEVGQSQTALSDALFTITSAGLRGNDALETLEASSKAAAIGLGETKDVAKAATAIVQAYGKENITAAIAIDQLTAIVREGNLEASELAPTLGKLLPVASQLGVSFDEVGANIATFTRLGVSSSESVTALKSLLSSIIKPSKQAAEELKKLGLSSEDLRKSISENGLASTLQSLIKAYDGNVEGLARLFPNVEGLANALGTAGAQGKEYTRIVESIRKSNGIVDEGFSKVTQTADFKLKRALIGLQGAASQLGAVIIPVVTDILDGIKPLVDGFGNLDESTKKLIVNTGLVVAVSGPLLSVVGKLTSTYATLQKEIGAITGGLKIAVTAFTESRAAIIANGTAASAFSVNIKAATIAFKSFNAVTKVSIIGLVATAVVATVVAFQSFNSELSTSEKIQRNLNTVQNQAAKSIAAEKANVETLISILEDENSKRTDKVKALNELKRINPEYFSGLAIEKGNVEGLTIAYDEYIDNITRAARVKAAESEIERLAAEQLKVQLQKNEILNNPDYEKFREQNVAGLDETATRFDILNNKIADYQKQIDAITKIKFDNLENPTNAELNVGILFDGFDDFNAAIEEELTKNNELNIKIPSNNSSSGEGLKSVNDILKELKTNLAGVAIENQLFAGSFDVNSKKAGVFKDTINQLLEAGLSPTDATIQQLIERFKLLEEPLELLPTGIDATGESFKLLNEQMVLNGEEFILNSEIIAAWSESVVENTVKAGQGFQFLAGLSEAATNSMKQAALNGESSLKSLGKAALSAGADFVRAKIFEGVSSAVSSALSTAPYPANLILAPLAGIAAVTLFNKALSTIKVPALAEGGLAFGPTLAVVGDNRGAQSDPEVIAPLSKLKDMLGNYGGGELIVKGVISGNDILLSNAKARNRRQRQTGR